MSEYADYDLREREMENEAMAEDELRALRDLWLSRLMFNPFVGWPAETRTFEEFIADAQEGKP